MTSGIVTRVDVACYLFYVWMRSLWDSVGVLNVLSMSMSMQKKKKTVLRLMCGSVS